tara:strand:- start:2931 stop:3215 length:285 start_codon:yes stop_codon:yes gene_type:complete
MAKNNNEQFNIVDNNDIISGVNDSISSITESNDTIIDDKNKDEQINDTIIDLNNEDKDKDEQPNDDIHTKFMAEKWRMLRIVGGSNIIPTSLKC